MTAPGPLSGPVVMVPVVGTAETRAAAEWAVEYVESRGGTLILLGTWPGLVRYGLPPFTVVYDPEPAARTAVQTAAGAVLLPPRQLRTELVRGDPGRVLAARSRDVDLLVVGREPRAPLVRALVGSLADDCVRRAACPVVVVPLERQGRRAAAVVATPARRRRQPAGALTLAPTSAGP